MIAGAREFVAGLLEALGRVERGVTPRSGPGGG